MMDYRHHEQLNCDIHSQADSINIGRDPSTQQSTSYSYNSLYSALSPAQNKKSAAPATQLKPRRTHSKSKSKSRKSSKSSKSTSRRSSKSSSSNNSKNSRSSSTRTSKSKSKSRLDLADYEVLDTVGCGSFAKVSRVRRKSSSEIFVWKELSYGVMSDKGKQMLCDEVNILRDLNHPNIVQFVDRIIDHEYRKIYIVQEYCNGGDLASYIKLKKEKLPKMSGRISETFVWSVTAEVLVYCTLRYIDR